MSHPRLSPSEIEERIVARCGDYQAGVYSMEVLRASLFGLGLRGQDLDRLVREQERIKWENCCAHN